MSHLLTPLTSLKPDLSFAFLAESQAVFHCHHFNLFLDQTIDDAHGPERGVQVRTRAAHEASYRLLHAAIHQLNPAGPQDALFLAGELLAAMGHGRLRFEVDERGRGTAIGENLHYGHGWNTKYGGRIRRRQPTDAFAAGFAAAAVEVAYELAPGSVRSVETRCCTTQGQEDCAFALTPDGEGFSPQGLHPEQLPSMVLHQPGKAERTVDTIGRELGAFARSVVGGEEGMIDAFGVLVTRNLPDYYNHITYRTIDQVVATKPEVLPICEELLRESGHVCVFYTLGGILASPEWEGMVGAPSNDPLEIITSCLGIARGLGFGMWTLDEFEPGKRLVFSAPLTYESAYHVTQRGIADHPSCYLLQGSGPALMRLAHAVDWERNQALTPELYNELFRSGMPYTTEEISCVSCGDDVCRVVVEAR